MESTRNARHTVNLTGKEIQLAPGYCLLRPIEDTLDVAGLEIPDSKTTKIGVVVAVADIQSTHTDLGMAAPILHFMNSLEVGATVYHIMTNGLEVTLDGVRYVIVSYRDIRLVISDESVRL